MIRTLFALLLTCSAAYGQAVDSISGVGAVKPNPAAASGGGGCADSATFLARGTFDAGHTTAYQNFICGLNTDGIGIFTGAWDALVILGTQNTTVAALNLPSTSFSPTATGSPTFTTDRGYAGTDGSSTIYIDTGWRPNAAVNLTNTNAHISVWVNTNPVSGATGGNCLGLSNGGANNTRIFPQYSDGNSYLDMNGTTQNPGTGTAGAGQYLITRSGATAGAAYHNGSSLFSSTTMNANFTALTADLYVLANNDQASGPNFGCGNQVAAYSIGTNLTGTQITNFYNRLRTLGTALGWP